MEWKKQKSKEGLNYALLSAAGIITLLAVWQLVVSVGLVNERMLPAPTQIFETLMYKFANKAPDGNVLWVNILASLQVALSGFLAAIIIGVPLGLVMGWWTYADRFIRPIFELVRPVPPIAWIPIVIMWFGIGEFPKVLLVFIGTFVPLVINTSTGIEMVDKINLDVGHVFGGNNRQILTDIVIPTALPSIFAGIRTSVSSGWTTVLAAEMLGAQKGLGALVTRGWQGSDMALVLVSVITIAIIGALLSLGLQKLEKVVCPWNN